MAAAVYGFAMSYYFAAVRKHSYRDPWYGLFLTSFTLTQCLDSYFWWRSRSTLDGSVPCDAGNLYFTKIFVSAAIFSQVIVITAFPSQTIRPWVNKWRAPYRILPTIGAVAMAVVGKCTYATVTEGGLLQLPTLVYWGHEPPVLLFYTGVVLWSVAAMVFITPWWAATNILIVGGINLSLLMLIDGTVRLISKLCFYCLLLSVLWMLEPLWTPKTGLKAPAPAAGGPGYTGLAEEQQQQQQPRATCMATRSAAAKPVVGSMKASLL